MLELGVPRDRCSSPHGGPWKIPLAGACLGSDRCPAGSCLSAPPHPALSAPAGGLLVPIGRVTQEGRPGRRHLRKAGDGINLSLTQRQRELPKWHSVCLGRPITWKPTRSSVEGRSSQEALL